MNVKEEGKKQKQKKNRNLQGCSRAITPGL